MHIRVKFCCVLVYASLVGCVHSNAMNVSWVDDDDDDDDHDNCI